jgi:hypothetical protein
MLLFVLIHHQHRRKKPKTDAPKPKRWNKVRLARSSRKNRVQQRKTAFLQTIQGGAAE